MVVLRSVRAAGPRLCRARNHSRCAHGPGIVHDFPVPLPPAELRSDDQISCAFSSSRLRYA
jgi:hypothetical protein